MNLKTSTTLGLAVLAFSGMITSANAAGDGKALYTSKMCMTCHGEDGKKPILPSYPKINGQNKEYLVAQIKMIKDGTRSGGATAGMKALITTLNDDDIEAISQYLSEVE